MMIIYIQIQKESWKPLENVRSRFGELTTLQKLHNIALIIYQQNFHKTFTFKKINTFLRLLSLNDIQVSLIFFPHNA